jgi:hypothetical protein
MRPHRVDAAEPVGGDRGLPIVAVLETEPYGRRERGRRPGSGRDGGYERQERATNAARTARIRRMLAGLRDLLK